MVYNLIRGCDPVPAAWTTFNGKKLRLHAARKHPTRAIAQVRGRIGAVTAVGEQSIFVTAQGGQIEIFKLRYDGGKKLPAPQVCSEAGVAVGSMLGN